jgi:hypothetical protein
MFETLDCPHGDVIATPVTVSNKVIFVIAAIVERQADASTLEAVAAATAAAFRGLLEI